MSLKIQFWSDPRGEEFAVKLSNEEGFKACSSPTAEYTDLIDEAEYFSDLDYDWQFLLSHWTGVKNGNIRLLESRSKKAGVLPPYLADALAPMQKPNTRRGRRERVKPALKCHFCMLSYNSERERREHEFAWHSDKKKPANR